MRKTLPISLALAALAAAACSGVSQAATPSPMRWGKCPADAAPPKGPMPPNMRCATLKVPLDYRNPNGRKIDVAVSRLASTKPSQKRGVLLTNPGGPAAGLGYPALLKALGLPKSVQDRYDIIGFDPRGIGHSTPVTCGLTAEQQKYGNIPPYAHNSADVAKRAKVAKQIAGQCATSKTASMLPYVSTANTARDMDRIRAVLGAPKISYAGSSWGTYLGAVYTTLFPQHSDRIVLDSNLGPGGWDYPSDRLYSRGVQDRFPDFAKYAAAHHGDYGLGRTPGQVTAKYHKLAAKLDENPVQAPGARYDGALFRLVTFTQLYGDVQFPYLAKAWKALDAHQAPPPLPGGDAGGTAESGEKTMSGRYYMICNDSRWPTSLRTYQRNVAVDRVRYPLFGAAGANVQPCAYWKKPIERPVRISDRGPSNVLMVQNRRDPATPLAGAQKTRRAFGDRARMVTADQGGHGVYVVGKNTCANTAVTAYLATGRRPAHDSACAADPR